LISKKIEMERHILLSLIIIVFISCKTVKKESDPGDEALTKQDTIVQPYVFKECASKDDCVVLFDCYHDFLYHPSIVDYQTRIIADRYFDFTKLKECAVYLYQTDSIRRELADNCLYNYGQTIFEKYSNQLGRSAMPSGNLAEYTLKDWNSRRAFEVFLLWMSKNEHDSMGHGDCTNVGVKFFDQIVAPKIKTIYGQDLNDYLGKHLDYDNEKNYEDCFDSFYNTLYPLIKKAWEEGKIELHAPDFK